MRGVLMSTVIRRIVCQVLREVMRSTMKEVRALFDEIFFFFAGKRRHTRFWRDWSSDVVFRSIMGKIQGDLLHPTVESEERKHKLKRLVQSPNSFFMDVKCPGCLNIMTVFSNAQTVVLCGSCNQVLCQPTGGRTKLTEGCSIRRKTDSSAM
eukprot:TRINITY_DN6960_c1_g1_i1.p1 TRINITY_DN6960_c1_g1~~TRINITY_DN6960_c1_g1_i1.p1  ORF type:complete len:152 (+),score=6.45 TRINITY_DN6960_c1_g1_i1:117-572(+)